MKIDEVAKIAQSCFQGCPTIVLGSGATMPYGLPSMTALSVYLRDNLTTSGTPEEDAWTLVRTALGNGDHLEAALEGKIIPPSLLSKIVRLTWQCVNKKDLSLLETAANGTDFALGHLLYAMLNSTQNVAHIVMRKLQRGTRPTNQCLVLPRFSSGLFRAMFAMKEIWNGKEIHRRVSA